VNDLEPKDRGIAMVFQNYALYPHMTVFENLAFGLKVARKDKAFITHTINRTATALGLEKMLDRKPQALSGGQLMNNEKVGSQQDALPVELVIRNSCGARKRGKRPLETAPKKRRKASKLSTRRKAHAAKHSDPGVEL
jgi:hypothetical protein